MTKGFMVHKTYVRGIETTIVAFTSVPCVRAILSCVCDIIVHDFLEFNTRILYSYEKHRSFYPLNLFRDITALFTITTLFTVVKEKRKTILVSCFMHFDLIIDFILLVVIDGHLAWSYGRFSHMVSRISFITVQFLCMRMPGSFMLP